VHETHCSTIADGSAEPLQPKKYCDYDEHRGRNANVAQREQTPTATYAEELRKLNATGGSLTQEQYNRRLRELQSRYGIATTDPATTREPTPIHDSSATRTQ
jgi:hypothetical protein